MNKFNLIIVVLLSDLNLSRENKSSNPFEVHTIGNKSMEQAVRKHVSDSQVSSILDRRHLEDVTNHHQQQTNADNSMRENSKALIIDDTVQKLDSVCYP